ncbi:MAG TPA: hypothetical protein VH540_26730 [Ktedonobacterales bacterium]|jgi:hypothetical protein
MSTAWFDTIAAVACFRTFLPSADLSAFLPRLPGTVAGATNERPLVAPATVPGNGATPQSRGTAYERPPVPYEDFSGRALSFRNMVHVLLTCLAYGDRRRAQKHRANGGAPALRQPPALETLQGRSISSVCAAIAEGTFSALLDDDLDLLVRLAARTRRALLRQEANAAEWQAALEQQMRRVWVTLDSTLRVWEEEELLQAEEEGWRACWRRLFGTRPPKALLPERIKTYKPAWAQARPPALQIAERH